MARRRTGPPTSRSAVGAAVDVLEDLDAPPPRTSGPPGHRPGRSGDRWRAGARGPVGVLAAAVVAAGLTGVLVAHHERAAAQARSRADLDRQRAEQVALALQAGDPVGATGAVGPADAAGWSAYQVGVPLLDRGPEPVTVTVLGLNAAHQRTQQTPGRVVLAPGARATVPLPVRVRCSALTASSTATAVDVQLRVRIRTPGADREVSLPLPPGGDLSASLAEQLARACAPGPHYSGTPTTWTPLPDGRLSVDVDDTPTTTLTLEQTPGLGVTSDPPLPLTTRSGRIVIVTLSLHPDCSQVGDGSTATAQLLETPAGQGPATLRDRDTGVLPMRIWLARQVALRCR